MHLFEYYFEGTKAGDWMLMYQVIAKNRTDAEELINKISEPSTHDVAALKAMRCTVKLIPEYLHREFEMNRKADQFILGGTAVVETMEARKSIDEVLAKELNKVLDEKVHKNNPKQKA